MSDSKSNKNNDFFGNGHWEFHGEMSPENYFGFTYLVVCTKTDKQYVGRKQYKHAGKTTSRHHGKETNWRTYIGSSIHLKAHIEQVGYEHMRFICLGEYSCKGDLVYAETEEQVKRDVLRAKGEDGKRKFYNGQIAAIKFIPANKPFNYNQELEDEFTI